MDHRSGHMPYDPLAQPRQQAASHASSSLSFVERHESVFFLCCLASFVLLTVLALRLVALAVIRKLGSLAASLGRVLSGRPVDESNTAPGKIKIR